MPILLFLLLLPPLPSDPAWWTDLDRGKYGYLPHFPADIVGHDIKTVYTRSECERQCDELRECRAFVSDGTRCWLKDTGLDQLQRADLMTESATHPGALTVFVKTSLERIESARVVAGSSPLTAVDPRTGQFLYEDLVLEQIDHMREEMIKEMDKTRGTAAAASLVKKTKAPSPHVTTLTTMVVNRPVVRRRLRPSQMVLRGPRELEFQRKKVMNEQLRLEALQEKITRLHKYTKRAQPARSPADVVRGVSGEKDTAQEDPKPQRPHPREDVTLKQLRAAGLVRGLKPLFKDLVQEEPVDDATCSSSYSNLNDGDMNTMWAPCGCRGQWVIIDLGAIYDVSWVRLINGPGLEFRVVDVLQSS